MIDTDDWYVQRARTDALQLAIFYLRPTDTDADTTSALLDAADMFLGWITTPREAAGPALRTDDELADLGLRPRVRRLLHEAGIDTLAELLQRSPDDLLAIRGFGEGSLSHVRWALAKQRPRRHEMPPWL